MSKKQFKIEAGRYSDYDLSYQYEGSGNRTIWSLDKEELEDLRLTIKFFQPEEKEVITSIDIGKGKDQSVSNIITRDKDGLKIIRNGHRSGPLTSEEIQALRDKLEHPLNPKQEKRT